MVSCRFSLKPIHWSFHRIWPPFSIWLLFRYIMFLQTTSLLLVYVSIMLYQFTCFFCVFPMGNQPFGKSKFFSLVGGP
jgi:hypothetical protein